MFVQILVDELPINSCLPAQGLLIKSQWSTRELLMISQCVMEFTPLCLTWASLVGDGLAAASPWIPPEV